MTVKVPSGADGSGGAGKWRRRWWCGYRYGDVGGGSGVMEAVAVAQ